MGKSASEYTPLNLPCLIKIRDYHEIPYIKTILNTIIKEQLQFEEIYSDEYDYEDNVMFCLVYSWFHGVPARKEVEYLLSKEFAE